MKIQSLDELEHSIGGRPRTDNKKTRIVFYIDKKDHALLREYAQEFDIPISEIARNAVKAIIYKKNND
ncbi:MAG TPA: ribbon-helix-helix domain-containing protein [Kangiella sp.]